ncbi:hypothetical protein DL93DRAFT_2100337 [Clavulina sp. PMI_390]|nr:hypothetical protein DL93DRAFT_2100337 [Clavulina sp. PMI_390]
MRWSDRLDTAMESLQRRPDDEVAVLLAGQITMEREQTTLFRNSLPIAIRGSSVSDDPYVGCIARKLLPPPRTIAVLKLNIARTERLRLEDITNVHCSVDDDWDTIPELVDSDHVSFSIGAPGTSAETPIVIILADSPSTSTEAAPRTSTSSTRGSDQQGHHPVAVVLRERFGDPTARYATAESLASSLPSLNVMDYVWGKYSFTAEMTDELEFKKGERIMVLEKDEDFQDGWWKGKNEMGNSGIFPRDYTTNVPPEGANKDDKSRLSTEPTSPDDLESSSSTESLNEDLQRKYDGLAKVYTQLRKEYIQVFNLVNSLSAENGR